MKSKNLSSISFLAMICLLIMSACGPAVSHSTSVATVTTAKPAWFDIKFTDVRTGKTFRMNDFDGKVVLIETMAMWCPNCIFQAGEVRKTHELLGNPNDLISVSLDIDLHEDAASLKEYTNEFGFEWYFAIAPHEAAHDIGNLYGAQYLNPPVRPMLIIDRQGNVHQLPHGAKDAETLKQAVSMYLVH